MDSVFLDTTNDRVTRSLRSAYECAVISCCRSSNDAIILLHATGELRIVLERSPIGTNDAEVRSALQDLRQHLIAETIRQCKRDNQRRDTHRNAEYRSHRRRPRQPPLPSRPQVPKCKKEFVRHRRGFSRKDAKDAKTQRRVKYCGHV